MSNLPAAFRLPARSTSPAGVGVLEPREKREYQEHPAIELLQGMTLSEFRRSGIVVVVRCSVLGDVVVWAADNTPEARLGFDDKGRVVYHGEELRLLLALAPHPEDLVAYHAMRKAVGWVEVESLGMEETKEPIQKKDAV